MPIYSSSKFILNPLENTEVSSITSSVLTTGDSTTAIFQSTGDIFFVPI